MKQFLLPAPPDRDGCIRITGGDFHYLVHVRRLKPGDRFKALLPGWEAERRAERRAERLPGEGGNVVTAEVRSVEGGALTVAVVSAVAAEPEVRDLTPLPPILLFQALPRGSKMDLIVRQAAEGALSEVVPFAAERSVARAEDPAFRRGGGERRRRWERIIREALQQSGSTVPTTLHAPLDGEGLFAYWEELRAARPGALGILFHQERAPDFPPGPLALTSLHQYLSNIPDVVALAVGPEGGFSPAEVSRFLAAGFKPCTIGATILRTETAALYGAAAVRTILLESASWTQTSR